MFLDAYHREHGCEPIRPAALTEIIYKPVEGVRRPNNAEAAAWYDQIVSQPIPMIAVGERRQVNVPRTSFTVGKLKLSVGAGRSALGRLWRVYYSTRKHRLISVDVQSFYPSLIASKGISPTSLRRNGYGNVQGNPHARLEIKRQSKSVEDTDERENLDIEATALKLVLNSTSRQVR